jgi:nucleotide-binding universal stress UspA family protein
MFISCHSIIITNSMFRKILVPIDGSKPAHDALETALNIAKIHESVVEILHVISYAEEYLPIMPYPSEGEIMDTYVPPKWITEYSDNVRALCKELMNTALKQAKIITPDVNVSTKLLEGSPSREIVREAEEGDFDLIVIGSRGLSRLQELFLGNVSSYVVNNSKIPVLVVK